MVKIYILFFLSFVLTSNIALSQYAPQVGTPGTTAIHKDSSIIQSFVNYSPVSSDHKLIRGWQNCADTSLGKASVGSIDSLMKNPFSTILSLGDGGSVTFKLNGAIHDFSGPDFVIFENGFPFSNDSFFLELAFVEVSTDGQKFYRFPANSKTDTSSQIGPFGSLKANEINNLAGKYVAPYGVPFDLEDLKDSLGSPTWINYIRIIDVTGSINPAIASRDVAGRKVNDPWPTPFPSSGFDLTAIGLMNQYCIGELENFKSMSIQIYPNPQKTNEKLGIFCAEPISNLTITDASGKICYFSSESMQIGSNQIDLNIAPGLYFLSVQTEDDKTATQKLIVQP